MLRAKSRDFTRSTSTLNQLQLQTPSTQQQQPNATMTTTTAAMAAAAAAAAEGTQDASRVPWYIFFILYLFLFITNYLFTPGLRRAATSTITITNTITTSNNNSNGDSSSSCRDSRHIASRAPWYVFIFFLSFLLLTRYL
jgi:hypothetical protein